MLNRTAQFHEIGGAVLFSHSLMRPFRHRFGYFDEFLLAQEINCKIKFALSRSIQADYHLSPHPFLNSENSLEKQMCRLWWVPERWLIIRNWKRALRDWQKGE